MSAKFDPNGELSQSIARYCIQKAQEALGQGVNASEGDYTWQTFQRDQKSLAKSIADRHPGGQSDHFRLARNNFNRQASKFVEWLASGRGYTRAFLNRAGLLESGLGGSEGNTNLVKEFLLVTQ